MSAASFFQADEQNERSHLDLFAREVAPLLRPRVPLHFDSWDEALATIGELARDKPLAIVLDEFQWLMAAQPSLESIVQRHWDEWQRDRVPVTLILSGSALRLMEGLLGPGAPLYGRADYRPLLEPLDCRDASLFASRRLGTESRLRRYAVLGGMPQYQVWAGQTGLFQLITERILRQGRVVIRGAAASSARGAGDPRSRHLLRRGPRDCRRGRARSSEIANATQISTPNLTKMLSRLEALGYLEARLPLSPKGPEARRASYRLADPFFRFWFRFVFPNRSLLERGRVKEVLRIVERDMDIYMGLAFEDCCRECSRGRYDLLASCKWARSAPTSALEQLLEQRDTLPRAGGAKLAIFARGFSRGLKERAEEDVALIGIDRLFE